MSVCGACEIGQVGRRFRANDEKIGVTFHGGHTQPPKQQERSETKDGESWLWEHTYVKVEWF